MSNLNVNELNINLFKDMEIYKKHKENVSEEDLSFVKIDLDEMLKKINSKEDFDKFALKTQLEEYAKKNELSVFVTKKELDDAKINSNGKVNLSSYATKEELDKKADKDSIEVLKDSITTKVNINELNKLYKSAIITEDNKLKLIKNNDVVEELPLPKGFSGNYSDLNGIPSDLVNISTLDNKLSSKADKVELEKYQPKGNYASDDDFSYLEEEIEKFREDTDDLLSNFISAGRFVSDISFEDGKLAIQTFPTLSTDHAGQPKRIKLDLPRYDYSDLINIPKDLVNSSILEEKLRLKANVGDLNNYQLKGDYALKSDLTDLSLKNSRDNSNLKIWTGSQANLDGITNRDANTLYFVTKEE